MTSPTRHGLPDFGVVPDQVAGDLPHPTRLWRARSLAADRAAVYVEVPVGRTYLVGIIVDLAIAQLSQGREVSARRSALPRSSGSTVRTRVVDQPL